MSGERLVTRALAGYLCGTHSGLIERTRRIRRSSVSRLEPETISASHRRLRTVPTAHTAVAIASQAWAGGPGTEGLRDRLAQLLKRPEVIDIVLFGSQADSTTTGFSDVDAVLLITDEAAEDPHSLRLLRPHVLDAERAVIAYQPMQHHGFEVATPKLLRRADTALALPEVALAHAKSLSGTQIECCFEGNGAAADPGTLNGLAGHLAEIQRWPRHPWRLHRLIAMFEILPVLYLQSRGRMIPKRHSFAEAGREFRESWWPYDVLNEVRAIWPRERRPILEASAAVVRNPWVAVAAWRRLPVSPAREVQSLLSEQCLDALRALAGHIAQGAQK